MKIKLEKPFSENWRQGYLVINRENRRNVILYNSNKNRTTISYARYLICVALGNILEDGYEVDHIDGDKTNDDLANLQVLKFKEHRIKSGLAARKLLKHGTLSSYRYCKCVICKNGNYIYHSKGKEAYLEFLKTLDAGSSPDVGTT